MEVLVVNAVPENVTRMISTGSQTAPATPAPRRRRRRSAGSRRAALLLGSFTLVAAIPVVYIASCASATRHCYQHSRLQARLHQLQVERKLLEAQVADLQRTDRVLHEAKRIGMQPREALQYVAIVPPKAPAREIRQAYARP
ncbi:MAG TPA: hypothetical protein GX715_18865 [Armatimonadetes bacterium]|jgi:cell division protein FtsL|nr:hypothetical protein [Armatimonadota bacterium]